MMIGVVHDNNSFAVDLVGFGFFENSWAQKAGKIR